MVPDLEAEFAGRSPKHFFVFMVRFPNVVIMSGVAILLDFCLLILIEGVGVLVGVIGRSPFY